MAFRQLRLTLVGTIFAVILWTAPTHALAPENDDSGCQLEGPLLTASWNGTMPENGLLGVWRIPLSPRHPEILTEARLLLEWESLGGVRATFSFPDPLPYGIPFSFQKIEVVWDDGSLTGTRLIDWSDDCSGAGRSLFPGQSWGVILEPSVSRPLRNLRLRLWGARN
ncbi:MAG: hypothetical protein A2X94_07505 [Bdellovibrionales bacterium GWB1_55_8]|nr:MAG: hypothetical protein A2X94_07505 [Bdellovibrionales bacterium GWB1_55_8]